MKNENKRNGISTLSVKKFDQKGPEALKNLTTVLYSNFTAIYENILSIITYYLFLVSRNKYIMGGIGVIIYFNDSIYLSTMLFTSELRFLKYLL